MSDEKFTMQRWTLLSQTASEPPLPAPEPNATWTLPGGTAWVYYAAGHTRLTDPVILSDGFEIGQTNLDILWDGLDRKEFPFATGLLTRGKDLILLGYDDRSASILENAEAAIACIERANLEKDGDRPLVVGGFSMGGIVTRYALARMEHDDKDHQTATYLSYDSPHRGAWIPLSVQTFAHFFKIAAPEASEQINSPAARQMLEYHIDAPDQEDVGPDAMRASFLDELRRVGWWPQRPRKLGVANGVGGGFGNGVEGGALALEFVQELLASGKLYTQSSGDEQLVAELLMLFKPPCARKTSGLLELDGAPGGTLSTFEIAAAAIPGATCHVPTICFVPTVSAVAIGDINDAESLYANVDELDPASSELDEFKCCTAANTPHTAITTELAEWILAKLT